MELILDLIYIYIAVFSVYFFVMGIISFKNKTIFDKDITNNDNQYLKFAVVLYSHNNYNELKRLINQIKTQKYPNNHVTIYTILDNCSDHSVELLENEEFVKIMNINDGITIGKDQAVSILIEDLRERNNFDSYIFIDINRYIDENFLECVNNSMRHYPITTGQTITIGNNLQLSEKIKLCYEKYLNDFIFKSRAKLGLAANINEHILCVNKKFLEKIDSLDLNNVNSQLKYSLLLSKLKCPCLFDYNIKTYIKSFEYEIEKPSLSYRLKLFKNCVMQIFTRNYKFTEHVFSLIVPSGFVAFMVSLFFLIFTAKYYFIFNFSVVFLIFSMLLLGFAISILKSEMLAKDFLYLILYPIYSCKHIFLNFPPNRFIIKLLQKNKKSSDIQKYSVKVLATNGQSEIPCKLDLISENGLAKVVFTFKNKKFTSSRQIRMVEALIELIRKLNDYGFDLKICYCCKYFESIIDGTQNMIQGECKFEFRNKKAGDVLKTVLWNSCSACTPKKMTSIIDNIQNIQWK